MIKATHENGYSGEVSPSGALLVTDQDGNEILSAKHCGATTEASLLGILRDVPSFLSGIVEKEEDLSTF